MGVSGLTHGNVGGVGDKNVEVIVLALDRGEHLLHPRPVGGGAEVQRAARTGTDLLGQGVVGGRFVAAAVDQDVGAGFGEGADDGPPDTAVAAHHQDCLAGEIAHLSTLILSVVSTRSAMFPNVVSSVR